MEPRLSLTYFAVPSEAGTDLMRGVTALAERLGYDMTVAEPVTQWTLMEAVATQDVVVFDATIEDEQQHIYHAGAALPALVDHLLVVGRSYLPINFIPARSGGTPDYPFPYFDPRLDHGRRSWSNADILTWLEPNLAEFRARGPRPAKIDLAAVAATEDPDLISRTMKECYSAWQPRIDPADRVFLSYRSRLWGEIQELKSKIECGELHGGLPQTVKVLPPGALVYEGELLSAARRWQLLSFTDRLIADCAEMIAYTSADYLASWWTQGELLTLCYRRGSGSESQPKLRVLDPNSETLRLVVAPAELAPAMNEPQLRRMARWYAHTDPLEMGPETLPLSRRLHKLIRFVPNTFLAPLLRMAAQTPPGQMMLATAGQFGSAEEKEKLRSTLVDPGVIKEFFRDEIWSEAFWDDVLFECPLRRKVIEKRLDITRFLTARPAHLIGLGPEQMQRVVADGTIACSHCGGRHAVLTAPPRYLWAPLRMGQTRTASRTGLKQLETYVVLKEEAGS